MKFKFAILMIALITFTVSSDVFSQQSGKNTVLATGTFIQADLQDTLHWGKGELTAFADRVEFSPDFEVPLGPKYHVYLMFDKEILKSEDVNIGGLIDLGRLEHFNGAQSYPLPRGVDLSKFGSIIIYCEGFKTLISPAGLNFVRK